MSESPPPPSSSAAKTTNNNDDDPYFSTLDSIMRVTVAGFGGALAGMSFARRGGGGATAISRQAASALNKTSRGMARVSKEGGNKRLPRQRPIIRTTHPSTTPYVDRELPTAWAMACMAFASVIECTRLMSPTSIIWDLARGDDDSVVTHDGDDTQGNNTDQSSGWDWENVRSTIDASLDSSMVTISDYMIGGAIAGALFKGSAVRTPTGARIDSSIMGVATPTNFNAIRGKPLSGILPGAALGLLAGVAVVAMDRAQVVVQEKFGHLDDDDDDGHVVEFERGEAPIPADIQAMSNEELMKSIDSLKSGKSKSSNDSGDGKETDTSQTASTIEVKSGEHEEVCDLISALGFRTYRSH